MPDEIIDRGMASMVQTEARRTWQVVGWIVSADDPGHPGKFVARLLCGRPSPYVLLGDTLTELRAQLPAGLSRQPVEPEGAVELWYAL
ncbi:hypothetical protein [Rhodopila globiformis]|uniref:Uncharacterized protein n=1 Tax=Rhodopila globiformis TaxID=1071 RepID=A0A2S6N7S1_RHOGL|nr:hypothetical protein [Rhodopila globiformis]PPQ30651.1 hypothetical protein CCS01_18715 [Rhodopila globiformis]